MAGQYLITMQLVAKWRHDGGGVVHANIGVCTTNCRIAIVFRPSVLNV